MRKLLSNEDFKNLNCPSVYNMGYLGVGDYFISNGRKINKNYSTWSGILRRCNDLDYLNKHPTYKAITVCEEWHNFQVFAKWFEENWKPWMEGWHLDKDILIKGNKVYSPETCCFVPQEINNLFTKTNSKRGEYPIGVNKAGKKYQALIYSNKKLVYLGLFNTVEEAFKTYKLAKEKYIKKVADKWKEQIDEKVYESMYNYKVEITD